MSKEEIIQKPSEAIKQKRLDKKFFNKIKKDLRTKVVISPSQRYVAQKNGVSVTVVSFVNKCNTYEEYKAFLKQRYLSSLENKNKRK